MTRFLLIAATTSLLAACSNWVQVTNEGAGVRLANAGEVGNCRRLGRTQAQTMSRVVVVERGNERVQEELSRLARNEAGSMGGNTIVPESVIDEGRQTFGVYSCPN